MKRIRRLVVLAGLVTLGGGWLVAAPAQASVNDFHISDYQAELRLGRDSEQRSTLTTTETITAEFPDFDQNHGLERAIPTTYRGHKTHLQIQSITDENGLSRDYKTHSQNDNLIVRIGDASSYVHGRQVYKITYTQRDVTNYFADTRDDEFYWDINGVEWQVPIDHFSARITIGAELQTSLTGKSSCYQGVSGSTDRCMLTTQNGEFTVIATNLQPRENITVAIGFKPNTFAAYKQSIAEKLMGMWLILQAGLLAVVLPIVVWLGVQWNRVVNRSRELGTVVPEYLPPKNTSVTVAAQISQGAARSVMAAQLIDLAVRHYIKIYQVKEKTLFGAAEYEIEIVKDPSDLVWEEKELLSDSFGTLPSVGQRLNLKTLKNSTEFYKRTRNNDKDLNKLIRGDYGLRAENKAAKKSWQKIAAILGIAAVVLLSPSLAVIALIVFGCSFALWALTDKGLTLRRYLLGLKQYISVAEAERLKMLQSPEGAEKVASVASGTDQKQLIKLYERVLPYAILFGQEKQWNKQLGSYYEHAGSQPDWYTGSSGVYNAAMFSSAMSGLTTATNYASSSSSSTGGSSGGGSSGGGGGGGGGGGW